MASTIENPYLVFLTIEIARKCGFISSELEYDLTWNIGCSIYKEFCGSEFNDQSKPAYECVEAFLSKKRETIVPIILAM